MKRHILRLVLSLVVITSIVGQGTWVLAGTTGTMSGVVLDASGKAIAGAKVTAASPSQTATATTDASGRYTFLALSPDTYTLSAEKSGFDIATSSGVSVFSDQNQTYNVTLQQRSAVIGRTTARSNSDLVKPGQTADVYSISPALQAAASTVGGGGTQNSAWSAIATVPGVFVNPNQAGVIGAGATISIRGGDYNQVGYELDGIPVNRAYDAYPSTALPSLGQQEAQVYTGAAPASAESQGLSGFINQVIKTGTYPDYQQLTASIGSPSSYQKVQIEFGGATQDRRFSYYVGVGGFNQAFRITDNFNGQSLANPYGVALAPCDPSFSATLAPSCYTNGRYNSGFVTGPYYLYNTSNVVQRDAIANFHYQIPRANGLRDDIQVLGDINFLRTSSYESPNDQGGIAYLTALGLTPTYFDSFRYTGATGVALPSTYKSMFVPYLAPGPQHAFGDLIPANYRPNQDNNQAIFKLGWTHPFSETSLFKIYGYSYYAMWQYQDPNTFTLNYAGYPADYYVQNFTRGVSGQLLNQLGAHLVTLQGSYNYTNTSRYNNAYASNPGPIAVRVDPNSPFNGVCYNSTGKVTSCYNTAGANQGGYTNAQVRGGLAPNAANCGTGPCTYYIMDTGDNQRFNHAQPSITTGSLSDQWKPSANLTIDLGIRYDLYQFNLPATLGTNAQARQFYINAFNAITCVNSLGQSVQTAAPGTPCPAGYSPYNLQNNLTATTQSYPVWEPRFGMTYSLDPRTVLRLSYGRYSQQPNDAFQQYDTTQNNLPPVLRNFALVGFYSPNHPIPPATSNNLDLSLSRQFGDTSIKITPFLRKTQNQTQQFYIDQRTNFVSGVNVGTQTSQGIEFEIDKGNFARNGLAARFTAAYTNSYISYSNLATGVPVVGTINQSIQQFNAYTSYCASNPQDVKCSQATASGAPAAPCYTTAGAADAACGPGSIANPYWNANVQGLLPVNGNYPTYDLVPGGLGGAPVASYGAPYTASLIVQYKKDKFTITPALQFYGGQRYGLPFNTLGVAPDTCTGALAVAPGSNGNYFAGGRYTGPTGGTSYDAATCATIANGIPNQTSGYFDGIGQYVLPSNLQLHLQMSYDITPKMSLSVALSNLYNTCFGGTSAPWNVKGACGYGLPGSAYLGAAGAGALGNTLNPGSAISPNVQYPYLPTFGGYPGLPSYPFSVYMSLRIKNGG